ncbi:MAG: pyrroline-5-carboxylate reductase [Planctomycetota bacterium]|nr:pyrroline-5-carboxylate reductase [Planctomycetota bacterium]
MGHELGVLGVGHLATAILQGAFEHGVLEPRSVLLADHDHARLEHFAAQGCLVVDSTAELNSAPRVLCAVRPQEFAVAAEELGALGPEHLLISVMAGLGAESIRAALGGDCRVVRTMPNMGALLHCSMTAVSPGPGANADDIEFVDRLFGAVGLVADVEERLLSAATAVSGSGPGWVYLLAAAMVEAAESVGFDPSLSDTMVRQTILAAARNLEASDRSIESLLDGIASKGGTTEAGLAAMREHGFVDAVRAGIVAARDRGDALGAADQ